MVPVILAGAAAIGTGIYLIYIGKKPTVKTSTPAPKPTAAPASASATVVP